MAYLALAYGSSPIHRPQTLAIDNRADLLMFLVSDSLDKLFLAVKENDEYAYVFALLGINSGMEDAGWQPIAETWKLHQDLGSIVNTPLCFRAKQAWQPSKRSGRVKGRIRSQPDAQMLEQYFCADGDKA